MGDSWARFFEKSDGTAILFRLERDAEGTYAQRINFDDIYVSLKLALLLIFEIA